MQSEKGGKKIHVLNTNSHLKLSFTWQAFFVWCTTINKDVTNPNCESGSDESFDVVVKRSPHWHSLEILRSSFVFFLGIRLFLVSMKRSCRDLPDPKASSKNVSNRAWQLGIIAGNHSCVPLTTQCVSSVLDGTTQFIALDPAWETARIVAMPPCLELKYQQAPSETRTKMVLWISTTKQVLLSL